MSYQECSIKEALERVNANVNGWFLPVTQRPYVWGSRYESELYICKLFDSLLRGFPIGGLILWNTTVEVSYREFINDYDNNKTSKIVDKGLWARPDKFLIYDGQQRLQTLYSCLKYSFNNRVLVYNLLFNLTQDIEPDETGFSFVDINANTPDTTIRMNELFTQRTDDQFEYMENIFKRCNGISDVERKTIGKSITVLWNIFVERGIKPIAYFPIVSDNENSVNEIFQRLNSGGMVLTQSDLLFSRIKERYFDFEEKLQNTCRDIYSKTGNGFYIEPTYILQIINLLITGTIRVDPQKIKSNEIDSFNLIWLDFEAPLIDFFSDFIFTNFKINNSAIVPKKLALIPLIVYFYELYKKGFNYTKINDENLIKLKKYFILSQLNDWNLQSMADNFVRIIKDSADKSSGLFEFPINEIKQYIETRKIRNTQLFINAFTDYLWFSLKILLPDRLYNFIMTNNNRFNPEIDHIFPKKLSDQSPQYYLEVDTIWNMQPIKGIYNNQKSRIHPREFFSSPTGSKYISEYDFLPATDFNDKIYDNPIVFIAKRKELMIKFMSDKYSITVEE